MKPKVAFIGTGGTISSVGTGLLDVQHYTANKTMIDAEGIVAAFPSVHEVADLRVVKFDRVPSTSLAFPQWRELGLLCRQLEQEDPDLAGIVIGHGTATLEETAYALDLTAKMQIPVVVVGSQRPLSALSTDAGLNLVNAARVAASPLARGRGVLVVLNDEIQAARDVSKTSTFRLQTFRTADFGVLGHVDESDIRFYRRTERQHAPDTEFDIATVAEPPRVDIAYSYAGADGAAVRAFVAAGAMGIVSAGFAPGMVTPDEMEALVAAHASGVVVVQSTRAGSGSALDGALLRDRGFIAGDNLTPQKARILLMMALTRTHDTDAIRRIFATY